LLPGRKNPKPPRDPEGRMTLVEHLRELRQRLFIAVAAILVGTIVAFIFRQYIYDFVFQPLIEGIANLRRNREIDARPNFDNPISPLTLMLKLSLLAGVVATCPVWIYQVWAFIMPGLHPHEKKWSRIFVATAAPLFLGGVALAYFMMPVAISFILNFTPLGDGDLAPSNFINVQFYLDFFIRLFLVFGLAFEVPIFVVALNMVGILSVATIAKSRRVVIFVFFVFAAVATPTGDPITMLVLAIPMTVLFLAAELVARLLERRKRARQIAEGTYVDLTINEDDYKD